MFAHSTYLIFFPHTAPDTINPLFGYYNMDPGSDYPPPLESLSGQIRDFPITQTTRVVCYNQAIYEDEAVEQDESFSLILIIQDNSVEGTEIDPAFSRAVLTIKDNDVIGMLPLQVAHSTILCCTVYYTLRSIILLAAITHVVYTGVCVPCSDMP